MAYELTQPPIPESMLGFGVRNALDGIGAVGYALDFMGRPIRRTLRGTNPFGDDDPSGRDVLETWGVVGPETGEWDWGDFAGFGLQVATDPISYLLPGAYTAKGLQAARVGSAARQAANVARKTAQEAAENAASFATHMDDPVVAAYREAAQRATSEAADMAGKAADEMTLGATLPERIRKGQAGVVGFGVPFMDTKLRTVYGAGSDAAADAVQKYWTDPVDYMFKTNPAVVGLRGLWAPRVMNATDLTGQKMGEAVSSTLDDAVPATTAEAHQRYREMEGLQKKVAEGAAQAQPPEQQAPGTSLAVPGANELYDTGTGNTILRYQFDDVVDAAQGAGEPEIIGGAARAAMMGSAGMDEIVSLMKQLRDIPPEQRIEAAKQWAAGVNFADDQAEEAFFNLFDSLKQGEGQLSEVGQGPFVQGSGTTQAPAKPRWADEPAPEVLVAGASQRTPQAGDFAGPVPAPRQAPVIEEVADADISGAGGLPEAFAAIAPKGTGIVKGLPGEVDPARLEAALRGLDLDPEYLTENYPGWNTGELSELGMRRLERIAALKKAVREGGEGDPSFVDEILNPLREADIEEARNARALAASRQIDAQTERLDDIDAAYNRRLSRGSKLTQAAPIEETQPGEFARVWDPYTGKYVHDVPDIARDVDRMLAAGSGRDAAAAAINAAVRNGDIDRFEAARLLESLPEDQALLRQADAPVPPRTVEPADVPAAQPVVEAPVVQPELAAQLKAAVPGLTDEKIQASFQAADAVAETLAARKGITKDEWWNTRVGKIERGPDGINAKGMVELGTGAAIITALQKADVTTFLHEFAHIIRPELSELENAAIRAFERTLKKNDHSILGDAIKISGYQGTVPDTVAVLAKAMSEGTDDPALLRLIDAYTNEKFARGFERYLHTGKAPTPQLQSVFEKLAVWFEAIYASLKDRLGSAIPKEAERVYDALFGGKQLGAKAAKAVPAKSATIPIASADAQMHNFVRLALIGPSIAKPGKNRAELIDHARHALAAYVPVEDLNSLSPTDLLAKHREAVEQAYREVGKDWESAGYGAMFENELRKISNYEMLSQKAWAPSTPAQRKAVPIAAQGTDLPPPPKTSRAAPGEESPMALIAAGKIDEKQADQMLAANPPADPPAPPGRTPPPPEAPAAAAPDPLPEIRQLDPTFRGILRKMVDRVQITPAEEALLANNREAVQQFADQLIADDIALGEAAADLGVRGASLKDVIEHFYRFTNAPTGKPRIMEPRAGVWDYFWSRMGLGRGRRPTATSITPARVDELKGWVGGTEDINTALYNFGGDEVTPDMVRWVKSRMGGEWATDAHANRVAKWISDPRHKVYKNNADDVFFGRDVVNDLHTGKQRAIRAITGAKVIHRTFAENAAEGAGIPLAKALRDAGLDMTDEKRVLMTFYRDNRDLLAGKNLDKLEVPADVVAAAARLIKPLEDPEVLKPLLRVTDQATGLTKMLLTIVWPANWVRNGVGGQYMNIIRGAFTPYAVNEASKIVLGNGDPKWLAELGEQGLLDPSGYRGFGSTYSDDLKNIGKENVTWSQQRAAHSKRLANEAGYVPAPLRQVAAVGHAGAGTVELWNRATHYIARRMDGYAPREAANSTKAAHYDYAGGLTDFEKKYVRRIVPFYCVPDSHEILTRDGWKHYNELEVGEEVLTINHQTHVSEWQPLQAVHTYAFDGELNAVRRGNGCTRPFKDVVMCTDNHRWPVQSNITTVKGKEYGGQRSMVEFQDMLQSHNVPLVGDYRDNGTSILSPRHAAILGRVVTDGYFRWRKNNCEMLVYQSPKNCLNEVLALLESEPREPHPSTGVVAVPVRIEDVKEITRVFRSKADLPKIVTRLSREAAAAMREAMFLGDGHYGPRGQQVLTQACERNLPVVEAFQILCHMTGDAADIATCDEKEALTPSMVYNGRELGLRATTSQVTRCHVRTSKFMKLKLNEHSVHRVPYTGVVWCPQTANGTWVCRYNGTVTYTGNSFAKLNAAAMFEELTTKPGGLAAMTIKAAHDARRDEEIPPWLEGKISIPVGASEDGKTMRYISSLGLPVEEALERYHPGDLQRTMQAHLSMLHPFIRGPLEYATGTQLFSGRDMRDLYQYPTSSPEINQLISSSPVSRAVSTVRQLTDERKGPVEKAINTLSGVKLTDVDVEAARKVAEREAILRVLEDSPSFQGRRIYSQRPGTQLSPEEEAAYRRYRQR